MPSAAAIRPTRVEVDLAALCDNARAVSRIAQAPLCAVVKANAYGHGAVAVARALARESCVTWFAVSLLEEGIELREAGIAHPILVLGVVVARRIDEFVHHRLTPTLNGVDDLEMLEDLGKRHGICVEAHLMLDTGMGRVGVPVSGFERALERSSELSHVRLSGLATHFACADTDDAADPGCMTNIQIQAFDRALVGARDRGQGPCFEIAARTTHMANSAACLRFPGTGRDMARPGLALYGNGPGPVTGQPGLRQVMRLVTRIVKLRDLDTGASVSYGALWRAERPTRVAVLPIGYADGVPRRMTGKAEVLMHGRRMPVIGAITMDTILVDVTELRDRVAVGDEAVVLGGQGSAFITTAEFAEKADRIEYEVTCAVSRRVPRVYTGYESQEASE